MYIVGTVIDVILLYTRIDLLQLAAKVLFTPNDLLHREFRVFLVSAKPLLHIPRHIFFRVKLTKRLSRARFIALHKSLSGKLPVFGQCWTRSPISCVSRVVLTLGVGNIPSAPRTLFGATSRDLGDDP
jgi:hypothetical protein